MSRLQQAAEAYKELERRRKDRSNKKSKNGRPTGGIFIYAFITCILTEFHNSGRKLCEIIGMCAVVGSDDRYLI